MYSFVWVPACSETVSLANGVQLSHQNLNGQQKKARDCEFQDLEHKYSQLKLKFEKMKRENDQLKRQLKELEEEFHPDQKRRVVKRRSQDELVKEFNCPYPACKKEYASNLALNLHIRNKHDGGTRKERRALLMEIIQAENRGQELPQAATALPKELLNAELKGLKQKLNKQPIEKNINYQNGNADSNVGTYNLKENTSN